MRVIALEEHYSSDLSMSIGGIAKTVNENVSNASRALAGRLPILGEPRIADMDAAGIDVQVLSLVAPGVQELDGDAAVRTAREENETLAEIIARHPSRFAGFATLPTPDPTAAADELEYAVVQLGFKGALINGHTRGRFLDEVDFSPIWERAEALDVPIYLHPTRPPQAVWDAYYKGVPDQAFNLALGGWGWHADNGMHALRLIVAGVFDRFPNAQVILGHMGEMIPFSIARACERMTPGCTHLNRRITDYFLENFYITTSGYFSDPPFQCAMSVIGADRIMFSVDYPFSSEIEAREWFDRAPMTTEEREKIAHGNAERLLKLEPAESS